MKSKFFGGLITFIMASLFVPFTLSFSNISENPLKKTVEYKTIVEKDKGNAKCTGCDPPVVIYYHRKLGLGDVRISGEKGTIDSMYTRVNFWYLPSIDSAVIKIKSPEDTLSRREAIELLKYHFPEDSIVQSYSSDR